MSVRRTYQGLIVLGVLFLPSSPVLADWIYTFDADEGPGACIASLGEAFQADLSIMQLKGFQPEVVFGDTMSSDDGRSHRFEISIDNREPYVFRLGIDEYFGDYRSSENVSKLIADLAAGQSVSLFVDGISRGTFGLTGSASALRELRSCE